jgi:hypothetical protein
LIETLIARDFKRQTVARPPPMPQWIMDYAFGPDYATFPDSLGLITHFLALTGEWLK